MLLEAVLTGLPAEQGIDDGLNLLHHLAFHLIRGREAELHQRSAEAASPLSHHLGRPLERVAIDDLLADQELAQPVVVDVGVREDHRAFAKVDSLSGLVLGKVEDPAFPVDVEVPDDVAECVAGEIALQFSKLRDETDRRAAESEVKLVTDFIVTHAKGEGGRGPSPVDDPKRHLLN